MVCLGGVYMGVGGLLVCCKVVARVFCVAAGKLLCGCQGEQYIVFLKRTQ